MTLPLNSRVSQIYNTDGIRTDFDFGFRPFYDPESGSYGLEVRQITTLGYAVIPKASYSIIPPDPEFPAASGTVRFEDPPAAGIKICIVGNTPKVQQLDLINYGRYNASAIENQFDFMTAIIQEWISSLTEETRQRMANDAAVNANVQAKFNEWKIWAQTNVPELSMGYFNTQISEFKSRWETAMQSVISGRVPAVTVDTMNGQTQQQINDQGAASWYSRTGGYQIGDRVLLSNGKIVKSKIAFNTANPNVMMLGWDYTGDDEISTASGRTQREKNNEFVTTRDYGSLGDGSGRRLSSTYTTLAQAQVKYPNARSLNDTFDLVATEKALLDNPSVKATAGNYVINRSIAVPTSTEFYGDGWNTIFRCTSDMPRYAHMVVNKAGDYIGEGNTQAGLTALINGNTGNADILISDMWLIGDLETTKIMTRSGVCLKNVKNSTIKNVRTSWTGYHGIDISDASEGHIVGFPALAANWETKPSENILVEGCFVEYHGDDGYTTHYSSNITFRNCLARFGSQIFSAENGFEVDDGSRNVVIDGCFAIREQAGFVVKCHDAGKASYNVKIINCISQLCGYGFWFYGNQTITVGNYSSAYSVLMANCSAMFTRRQELTWGRTHRDLLIQDFAGVQIENFTVIGWNMTSELKVISVADYQPFYKDSSDNAFRVTPAMMPYAETVIVDGMDVTRETSANILIEKNSRGISLNNIFMLGCQTILNHISIAGIADGVRGVTLSNLKFIDCSGGTPIFSSSDVTELSISHVWAESKYAVSSWPVYRSSAAGAAFANIELNNIRYRNYQRPWTFGTNSADPIKPYDSVKQSTLFVGAGGDPEPPLGIATTGNGVSMEAGVYYDVRYSQYIEATSYGHHVKSGHSQWFGQMESNGDRTLLWGIANDGAFVPFADNSLTMGRAGQRIDTIFAATAAINTSDERLKQQIRSLEEAEKLAGQEIGRSIKVFKFNDAVAEKGDDARIHTGVIAQQVIQIMESYGLDPMKYGFVCYDEWPATPEIIEEWDDVYNEFGDLIQPAGSRVVQAYIDGGNRYAIRYEELAIFVLGALF